MSSKTSKPTPTRLGLYITPERDRAYGDYFHIRAHVVTIGTTSYERRRIDDTPGYDPKVGADTIRNVSDRDRDADYGGLLLDNLRASSQGCSSDTPRNLYGFTVDYRDVYSCDRHYAEGMAKTLKTIERRMAKLADQYGRPVTFGQYLARLAAAVKATAFVFTERDVRGRSSYSEREHRITTVASGIGQVDRLTDQWVRELEQPAESYVATASGPVSDRTMGTAADYGTSGATDDGSSKEVV